MEFSSKIFIDRLINGKVLHLDEILPPTILEVNEKDLQFHTPITVNGQAYLTDSHLVLKLNIATTATLPCSICNDLVTLSITIPSFYHAEELTAIRGGIYDFTPPLREGVLLEVPNYVECNKNCSKRDNIKHYFAKGQHQHPFADLNIDE